MILPVSKSVIIQLRYQNNVIHTMCPGMIKIIPGQLLQLYYDHTTAIGSTVSLLFIKVGIVVVCHHGQELHGLCSITHKSITQTLRFTV